MTVLLRPRIMSEAEGAALEELSFTSFFDWVENNYGSYLDFRTITSVRYDVEMWFDDEFEQNWRR